MSRLQRALGLAAFVGVVGLAAAPVATVLAGASVTPRAAVTPRCHTADLSGRFGFIQGAAGGRFGPIVLTNRSHHTCTVRGYVGGLLVGSGGHTLHTDIVRDHSLTPHTVTLRSGRSAQTQIHWEAIPTGSETCPTPRSMEVTPPDETTHLLLHWTSDVVCGHGRIDVRPLVAR